MSNAFISTDGVVMLINIDGTVRSFVALAEVEHLLPITPDWSRRTEIASAEHQPVRLARLVTEGTLRPLP